MTYVDPTYVSSGGSGYDQTTDAVTDESVSFEYGSGGRKITFENMDAPGVSEGQSGTVMRGLQDANFDPSTEGFE